METATAYEQQLDRDTEWALNEGSRHFEENSAVHQALRAVTGRLNELGIPYAVVGGMALYLHGYRRFTEDVDLLVTQSGLLAIQQNLTGLGYVPLFSGSKNLRDARNGVRIEFIVTGQFPGDGKPKPVVFPDPAQVAIEKNGVQLLRLNTLIDLKLASGISSSGRLRDLADVQDLIRTLKLPVEFSQQLDLSVRDKYLELWRGIQSDAGTSQ
jgi:hypothetical protein